MRTQSEYLSVCLWNWERKAKCVWKSTTAAVWKYKCGISLEDNSDLLFFPDFVFVLCASTATQVKLKYLFISNNGNKYIYEWNSSETFNKSCAVFIPVIFEIMLRRWVKASAVWSAF